MLKTKLFWHRWICPLTGKPLDATVALTVDTALAGEIASHRLRRSLARSNVMNETYDVYEF